MVNILIGCMIAFLPLYTRISSVDIGRISKVNVLLYLLPLVILLLGQKVRSFHPGMLAIFCAAIAHTIIFQYEPASIWGFYQSLSMGLGMLFIVKYNESYIDSGKEVILNFMCLGAVIQSLVAIGQYLDFDIYHKLIFFLNKDITVHGAYVSGHKAIFGTLGNPNVLGAYLALCLPAFFRSNLHLLLSIPVGLAIGLAGSLIPVAAILIAISYYYSPQFKGKDAITYIVFPSAFYLFCFLYPQHTSDRSEIWAWYLSKIDWLHALIGKSASWLPLNIMRLRTGTVDNVHNEFFTAFNTFGIFALAAIGYMIKLICDNTSKDKIFASIFVAAFILSHGSFPMHLASTVLIIMVSIAYCLKGNYVSNLDG